MSGELREKRLVVLQRVMLLLTLVGCLAWLGTTFGAEQDVENPKQASVVSSHDLTYYLDPALVDFVRPGLNVRLTEPAIGQDQRLRVKVRITDPRGLPLDREGISTPGTVSLTFVAAYLPGPDSSYVAYTVRPQTSPITRVTAVQASSDTGGTWEKLSDGLYLYTFGTVLPASYDSSLTHAAGVYSSRNLDEFDLGTQFANDVIEFVPNGSPVTDRRDRVRTNSCNSCHDPLNAHGGARREVRLCVLCHTPQSVDPDTGNTVDFPVMVHKIHMGADLPSVKAGTPYRIIGFRQRVFDFSKVKFPDDVRNCERCHRATSQALYYLTKPTRATCGSCHDDVNFENGQKHVGLPQTSDAQCTTCHKAEGDLEFDASVKGSHTIPAESRTRPGVKFEILGVENGTAGNRPAVRFSIRNNAGDPLLPSEMDRLALVLSGPTSDYTASLVDDARNATGAAGVYFWTFSRPISADFQGTMAVGIEGFKNRTVVTGTNERLTVRDVGFNKVFYFDTSGGEAKPRRSVVRLENCNSCHGKLALHGTIRQNTEYCILCHTPLETDQARRPADKAPPESVHFKTMIHRIHTGEELAREFTVYGAGGRPFNFNEVRFPGDRRNCAKCHIDGTQQLPLPEGLQASVSPRDYLNPMQPETAACLSCHTSRPAAVHAQLQQSTLGEACAVCHGPRSEFSVNRVHAR